MAAYGNTDVTRRRTVLVLVLLALAGIALLAPAGRAQAASCPSFRVLNSDRIGKAVLPAGAYSMSAQGIGCAAASQRFTQFLEDWDGKLPGGWKVAPHGSGKATFSRSGQRFSVSKGAPSGGGSGGSSRGVGCPTAVSIPAQDRIGSLVIKKGTYRIVRLSTTAPSCASAAKLLGRFLLDFDGVLPSGWVLLPGDAAFVNGSIWNGFRIEPWTGRRPHTGPAKTGVTRCKPSFSVLHDDRIGPLSYPKGSYYLSLLKGSQGLTCAQASSLFTSFLSDPNGNLPSPWVINASTGSFRRGAGNATGFVAKPGFKVR